MIQNFQVPIIFQIEITELNNNWNAYERTSSCGLERDGIRSEDFLSLSFTLQNTSGPIQTSVWLYIFFLGKIIEIFNGSFLL